MKISPTSSLKGTINIPGDKSISHRSIMFGAISDGLTEVHHFLRGADCLSTIECFRALGVEIEQIQDVIYIHGKGLHGLKEPSHMLDTGNSGTTTRLISGILSGQPFSSSLSGDASIQKRPMRRILAPLREMNANIKSKYDNDCAPLIISPSNLHGISYQSPVASAQVKSCILLAGLYADTPTTVTEPALSRNHSELMLKSFGANITTNEKACTIEPNPTLSGQKIDVPGDISSAAYFIAAALLVPGSEILIENVGINPTRDGILKVALSMGARIQKQNIRTVSEEPVCDLLVTYTDNLTATTIEGNMIPALIDEIPIIAIMAACAHGTTIIRDAAELKVKESNRIDTVVDGLRSIGINALSTEDGMIIEGGVIDGGHVDSHLDHRIAMSFSIAGLVSQKGIEIGDADCVNISYPTFYEDLFALMNR